MACCLSNFTGIPSANVAELNAFLREDVSAEGPHHLVNLQTKAVITSDDFKRMFYSRGDDKFQIANVYDSHCHAQSIKDSVWGLDIEDTSGNIECHNLNKFGGRDQDPSGISFAYVYQNDITEHMFAQNEILANLEKDTNVKREGWTFKSRALIEDQLYALAFSAELNQDGQLSVSVARTWAQVEDSLRESCSGLGIEFKAGQRVDLFINVRVTNNHIEAKPTILRFKFKVRLLEGAFESGGIAEDSVLIE